MSEPIIGPMFRGGSETRPFLRYCRPRSTWVPYCTWGSTYLVNRFNCSAWLGEANRTMK